MESTLRKASDRIRVDQTREENLGHIDGLTYATWLAVADWLEGVAADAWAGLAPIPDSDVERSPEQRSALAVARAYLGGL